MLTFSEAEFRGPGAHNRFDPSDEDEYMDMDQRTRLLGGRGGRVILLGDGTEIVTGSGDDDDVDMDMLMDDNGGDTEGEEEHEAVTPHSSQDSLDARSGARKRVYGGQQKSGKSVGKQAVRIQDPNTEDMEAALVLCGLARLP